jgi:hypothetical protein
MNTTFRQQCEDTFSDLESDHPLTANRLWKVNAATRPELGKYSLFDAGYIVSVLQARFPPRSDFDCMIELDTHIEQRQFRLASNRVA